MRATPPGASPAHPRLNPFALPSDTTARFVLLIVAVLSASVFAYNLLAYALPSTQVRLNRAVACVSAVERTPDSENPLPIEARARVQRAEEDCRRPVRLWVGSVVGLGTFAVFLVALVVYVLIPAWKIRRRHLVPLRAEDAPELVAEFDALCHEAELRRAPTLLWNPLAIGGDALAFGRSDRTYVAVGAGPAVEYYVNRESAMAVLRHELAHLVNRDVTKAYAALSLWYAFLLAGVWVAATTRGTRRRR